MDKIGFDGFFWFFGVVEDVQDPLQLGRVKVRIHNIHSPRKSDIPTEDLPWAHVVVPATSAGFKEAGASPTALVLNSTVFGFFADGVEQQRPIVMGSLPGIPQPDPENVDPKNLSLDDHDVSRLARGINKLGAIKNETLDSIEPSPDSTYGTKYPFNKVYETPAGHVVEFDDTPGKERVHIFHKTGTYTEISSDGQKVDKVVGDHIEIVIGNQNVHIRGNVNILVDGTYTCESKGNMTFRAPRIDLNP